MAVTTVLFDLDGTLLPMDLDPFVAAYMQHMAQWMARRGLEPQPLTQAVLAGIGAMVKNDGSCTNEARFRQVFSQMVGEQSHRALTLFEEYYQNAFDDLRIHCGFQPAAREILDMVKAKWLRPVLATNPFFPAVATHRRIAWAGLKPEDFHYITTYENSCFCKPDPRYYEELLSKLALKPEECVMIGNDACEDTAAAKLGIPVFLLTDCLLNRYDLDYSAYPQGDYARLREYIMAL